jgi:hypothetical protein
MIQLKMIPALEQCLPPLSEKDYQRLKNSISKRGFLPSHPIVTWKEMTNTIVDGHHRYQACKELGIEPEICEESFKSLDDAMLYTLECQISQRDLTAAQRIKISKQMDAIEKDKLEQAAKEHQISGLKHGSETPIPVSTLGGGTAEVAQIIANKAHVAVGRVYEYQAVERDGVPELKEMMDTGEISTKAANVIVKNVTKEQQEELVSDGPKAVTKKATELIKSKLEKKKSETPECDTECVSCNAAAELASEFLESGMDALDFETLKDQAMDELLNWVKRYECLKVEFKEIVQAIMAKVSEANI